MTCTDTQNIKELARDIAKGLLSPAWITEAGIKALATYVHLHETDTANEAWVKKSLP